MNTMTAKEIEEKIKYTLEELESHKDEEAIKYMAKYKITPDKTFGVKVPILRSISKKLGKSHKLAQKLWELGYRETMIVASMVDIPDEVSEEQMEEWAKCFSYWEICDQVCQNLFAYTKYAKQKAKEWCKRKEEFIKRAGFVIIARLSLQKNIKDEELLEFLPYMEEAATDDRNFVKKAVSWALRQIGKRNHTLKEKIINFTKEKIETQNTKTAKWIAKDVIKDLEKR